MSEWLLKRLIYLLVILMALLSGYKFNRPGFAAGKPIMLLLATTFIFEVTAVVFAYVYRNNSIVYFLFNPIQIFMLTAFYMVCLSPPWSRTIGKVSVVIITIIIFSGWMNQGWKATDPYGSGLRNLYFIILSLLLFTDWLKKPKYEHIVNEPVFWINTMVLFFFSANVIFWSMYNLWSEQFGKLLTQLNPVLYYSNLVFYAGIGYSFTLQHTKK